MYSVHNERISVAAERLEHLGLKSINTWHQCQKMYVSIN